MELIIARAQLTAHQSKAPAGNAKLASPRSSGRPPRFVLSAVGLLVLAALIGYGAYALLQNTTKPATPARLKVGLLVALSGGSANMGEGITKGIQLARQQLAINNMTIVQEDSQCDPKVAAGAMQRLVDQRVDAIVGDGCSSASLVALPAANNAKIPMISPSASSPMLSIPNDYFFRVIPPDDLQGAFIAQTLYDKGYRKVAMLYTTEPYGSGMNTVFSEKFKALGGTIVATVSAEPDATVLDSQVKELKAAQPQVVFMAPNSVVTAVAAIKLIRAAGMTTPLYGPDVMYDKAVAIDAGASAEGLVVSTFPTGTKPFKQALANAYQNSGQFYAASQAYDSMHALQIAVQKGATTGEQIKNALPGISFEGVSAYISFDRNGEISNPNYKYDLFQVKNGALELVSQ